MTTTASTVPFHQLSRTEKREWVAQIAPATKSAILGGIPIENISIWLQVSPSDAALIRHAVADEAGLAL